ncbi:MAG: hypothetical protein HN909_01755 [Phycisphaerales bacterium]|nr:hypothetical protein [Phycisphaerales bacterium]MBT7170474.1 hypothetical protein [Phycisphaerales bacterium]
MKQRITLGIMTMVLVAGAFLVAQPAIPTPKAYPEAPDILKHIPSDVAGFVVAPNLKGTGTQFQQFIVSSGLNMIVAQQMPGTLDAMAAMTLQMGEGFNVNGGIAMLIPNPKAKGCELTLKSEPPMVALVAAAQGASMADTFNTVTKEGAESMVTWGPEQKATYCRKVGNYFALADKIEYLDAVLKSTAKPITLTDGHKRCYEGCGAFVYVGESMVPILRKATTPEPGQAGRMMAANPATVFSGLWGEEVKAFSVGVRMGTEGVIFDLAQEFKPGTAQAKMAKMTKPVSTSLVAGLPSMPYGIVVGGVMPTGLDTIAAKVADSALAEITTTLTMLDMKLPVQMQDDVKNLFVKSISEIKGVRMVMGSGGESSELAMGFVIDCKDSAKLRALLPQQTQLINDFFNKVVTAKFLAEGDTDSVEELKKFSVVCLPKALPTTTGTADVLRFSHPDLAKALKDESEMFDLLLGQDQIEVYITERGQDQLVISFGGGEGFLETLLAKPVLDCGADADIAVARKILGKNLTAEGYISAKNIMTIVDSITTKTGNPIPITAAQFTCTTPVAFGSTVIGSSAVHRFYIPAGLVKDGMNIFMGMMMGPMGPDSGPDEEF